MSTEIKNEVNENKEQNVDKQRETEKGIEKNNILSKMEESLLPKDSDKYKLEKQQESPKELSEKAKEAYDKACENEKKITSDVEKSANENGGKLAGLEYKIKTPDSFQRKIEADMQEKGFTEDKAIDNIKDLVRYTSVSNPDKLAENYSGTLNDLKDKNYNVIGTKNTWNDEKNPYKGVNVTLQSPEGQKFELQFHTPESFEAKQKSHALYEEARLPSTSAERKAELAKEIGEISKPLEKPKDIDKI